MIHSDKKGILITMIIALTLGLVCYELYVLSNMNQKIDQLTVVETSDQQLRDNKYYQAHMIDTLTVESLFDKQTDFLLYIHNAECSACQITDEYFSLFIELGYHYETDIYFIDVSSSNDFASINKVLINKNIELQTTPALYLIEANEVSIQAQGADDIYDVLNHIAESVNNVS